MLPESICFTPFFMTLVIFRINGCNAHFLLSWLAIECGRDVCHLCKGHYHVGDPRMNCFPQLKTKTVDNQGDRT